MNDLYLDYLKQLLSIKSISMQDEYLPEMERTRTFLKDLLLDMGFEVQMLKAEKHDAVFGQRIVDEKLPTVLIYGHYDVQPPEPLEEWNFPPFEPTIRGNKLNTTD